MAYVVTIRQGSKVTRERFEELGSALEAIERQGHDFEREAHAAPAGGRLVRRVEPVQQVVARLGGSGPGRLRAGVDVRGEGSSEGVTGELGRRVYDQR